MSRDSPHAVLPEQRSHLLQWLLLPTLVPGEAGDMRKYRFATLFNYCALLGLAIHVLLIGFFAAISIKPMAIVNVISSCLWLAVIVLNRSNWLRTALLLAALEILGHAIVAVVYVGDYGGFQYYLFLIPLLTYFLPVLGEVEKFIATTLTIMTFVALHLYAEDRTAVFPLSHEILDQFFYFNVLATFIVLAAVSRYYNNAVDAAEQTLQYHNAHLENLAGTDHLTGVFNRRKLLDHFEQQLLLIKRSKKPLSVVLADLDNFKSINDRYGHHVGDQALVYAAQLIREQLRESDLLARWGGEEFLLLLPDTDAVGAFTVAEKIREVIAKASFVSGQLHLDLTITMGLSNFHPEDSIESCIQRADDALYQGKTSGKNRTIVR